MKLLKLVTITLLILSEKFAISLYIYIKYYIAYYMQYVSHNYYSLEYITSLMFPGVYIQYYSCIWWPLNTFEDYSTQESGCLLEFSWYITNSTAYVSIYGYSCVNTIRQSLQWNSTVYKFVMSNKEFWIKYKALKIYQIYF